MKSSSPVALWKKENKSNIKTDMQIGISPAAQDTNTIRPKVIETAFIHILTSLNLGSDAMASVSHPLSRLKTILSDILFFHFSPFAKL